MWCDGDKEEQSRAGDFKSLIFSPNTMGMLKYKNHCCSLFIVQQKTSNITLKWNSYIYIVDDKFIAGRWKTPPISFFFILHLPRYVARRQSQWGYGRHFEIRIEILLFWRFFDTMTTGNSVWNDSFRDVDVAAHQIQHHAGMNWMWKAFFVLKTGNGSIIQ